MFLFILFLLFLVIHICISVILYSFLKKQQVPFKEGYYTRKQYNSKLGLKKVGLHETEPSMLAMFWPILIIYGGFYYVIQSKVIPLIEETLGLDDDND